MSTSIVEFYHNPADFQDRLDRLVRQLGFVFEVENGADEIHTQTMSTPSVAIPLTHYFEHFDPRIHIFNHNPFAR